MLPQGYTVPETQTKSDGYLNALPDGKSRLRILDRIEPGYEWWLDPDGRNIGSRKIMKGDKPVRVKSLGEAAANANSEPYKHFMATVVYNYDTKKVQLWKFTQATIQQAIAAFESDPDYGDSMGYDIVIERKGEGLDTSYTVMPKPPKPIDSEVREAKMKNPIDLDEWFRGGNPFERKEAGEVVGEKQLPSSPVSDDDIPW